MPEVEVISFCCNSEVRKLMMPQHIFHVCLTCNRLCITKRASYALAPDTYQTTKMEYNHENNQHINHEEL